MSLEQRKIYGIPVSYSSRHDLMKKSIELVSTVRYFSEDVERLRPRLVETLAFYALKGYSNETKQIVCESLGVNILTVNQMNAELRKLGYLITDEYNKNKMLLHPDIQRLTDLFTEEREGLSKVRAMVIRFDG